MKEYFPEMWAMICCEAPSIASFGAVQQVFPKNQFTVIHLGVQVPCWLSCYIYSCCHFLWRHSRCINFTVQMASIFWQFLFLPTFEESTVWMFGLVGKKNRTGIHQNTKPLLFISKYLAHKPSFLFPPQPLEDAMTERNSTVTDRSAVEWSYWPNLTCVARLIQSVPAKSCCAQTLSK